MTALMEKIVNEAQADTLLALFESAPIAVIVTAEDGSIVMVNAKAETIFGVSRRELLGQPIEILLPPRFHERHTRHRQDYFNSPRTRPMGVNLTLVGQRWDGSEFPVEVGLSHIEIQGRPFAISFIHDITTRVEAAEALQQHASELERRVAERTREIERRQRVAEGLHDVLRVLNTARPLNEILDLIVEQASQLLATDAVAIYRQDEKNGHPHIQAARYADARPPESAPDREEHLAVEGQGNARSKDGAGAKDATDAQWVSLQRGVDLSGGMTQAGRYRSVLAVPLNVKGEIYGSVCLYYRAPRTFSQEEKELAIAFADQAALAIENARLRDQVKRSAVAAERSRLARELHDAVTQTLFSTSLIAEVLPRLWERNPEEAKQRMAELRELTRGALAEMRTLLLELRPAALKEAALGELLHQLADAITGRARIPVTVTVQGDGPLPEDVQIAFYRIAQEALNNVAKHSGATQTTISFTHGPDRITLEVRDNGRGFDPTQIPATHMGLGIMRERADAIGADLSIDSALGAGATIRAVWRKDTPTPAS